MVGFDDSALRAQVIDDFTALSAGVSDAAEMNRIFEAIWNTAVRTVRGLLNEVNSQNIWISIPSEILTLCFLRLPFKSRIRASHVCRAWRTAALGSREVWSNISLPIRCYDAAALLRMALPRAGGLPLSLRIRDPDPTPMRAVEAVLQPYLRHIKVLRWYAEGASSLWNLPMQHLEFLFCFYDPGMQRDFLGGRPCMLRGLQTRASTLPITCPALSTLVDLRISDMENVRDPTSFRRLFSLCPRLETLGLFGIDSRFAFALPAGPAPLSLRHLALSRSGRSYDIMTHYLDWETGRIRSVFLDMHFPSDHGIYGLKAFIRDARTLSVSCSDVVGHTYVLSSEHANGAMHAVSLTERYLPRLSGLVFAAKDVLRNVHTFKISAPAVEAFVPLLAVLDTLQHIVIHVLPDEVPQPASADEWMVHTQRKFAFDWAPLATYLPRLKYFMLGLATITIQVLRPRWDGAAPAHADDLRSLLTELSLRVPLDSLGVGVLMIIQGFGDDVVREVGVRSSPFVRLDTSVSVGHLEPPELPVPMNNPFPSEWP